MKMAKMDWNEGKGQVKNEGRGQVKEGLGGAGARKTRGGSFGGGLLTLKMRRPMASADINKMVVFDCRIGFC